MFAQWVAGYLSAANNVAFVNDKEDVLKGSDFDGLMAWIDNYCRANPLDTVEKAAVQLLAELIVRSRRK
jgi:hypothetical protein